MIASKAALSIQKPIDSSEHAILRDAGAAVKAAVSKLGKEKL
jgi:hypothetical protein